MLSTRHFFYLVLITISFAVLLPKSSISTALLTRVTNTGEEVINLNPSLSGDGRYAAFESIANLAGAAGGNGFRAIRADLSFNAPAFAQIGVSRAVAPAISQDGSRIAFASHEDLVGKNPDRNSEIFLFDGSTLRQITNTTPSDTTTRIRDGSFQPSITDDGRMVAFASNRNLAGQNTDLNFEILLFDTISGLFTQLTDSQGITGATDAKISGDGSRVAFIRDPGPGQSVSRDLMLHERATGATVVLAAKRVSLSMAYGRAISDDGLRIVYADGVAPNESQVLLFDGRSNTTMQITSLGPRAEDVPLQPSISGDGKRITFATRRNPLGTNGDRSVELFLYDVPTGQLAQLTNAPASASAEVVSSLNDDGSVAVFNFPRVLSGPVSANDLANNSEIYTRGIESRPAFGTLTVLNGASLETEPTTDRAIAPDSIAVAKGSALASKTEQAQRSINGLFPLSVAGTKVEVNGRPARLLFVSPAQVHFVVPPETEIGAAEVVLTNADGFQSRASVTITGSAPGLFTLSGDGRGEGVILNAGTLVTGPFDPTGGQLRLIVFATGARGSSHLSATILGRPITVESQHRSQDLPGLDEIHLLIPSDLRGTGKLSLTIAGDNRESNTAEVAFSGSFERDILINELLADPADGLTGDANHDNLRDSSDDEFVELVNTTIRDIDIGGFQLLTRSLTGASDIVRHRFAAGTIFPAGTSIVVFGGGDPDPSNSAFGAAQVFKASTGGLSLLNSGGVVTLRDPSGVAVTFLAYGGFTGLRGDANQSLTRSPDLTANFVLHQSALESSGRLFSPGTRLDGAAFLPRPAISRILLTPSSTLLNVGQELQFSARAFDQNNQELSGVVFGWQSSDQSVATIDAGGRARAIASGTAQVTASARGVQSTAALLTVFPIPALPPSPTPAPTPSPSPSPTPVPLVVISEFRTRGPNGASDEFVELYNNSDTPIDISGWKIRGSSNSGATTTRLTINAGTILPARGHFLATNSGGYSGTVAGDQTYSSGIANDGGIALTLPDDSIVDAVGMSAGSAFREGMHLAPLPSDANQSYERRPGGASGSSQDTGDNFTDFQLLTPGDPQNLSSSSPTPSPGPSPSPSVSPTPGPSPSATPSPQPFPSPSPSPSPEPSPAPTPGPTPSPSPAPSPVTKLVISQVYGGGGNTGAPVRNDFIEIFNGGESTVNLTGWSVQYATATGITWSVTNLTQVSLGPGQYYLVQESSGGSNGASLPPPDATGSIAMAATAGKVALVNTTNALTGACPSDNGIVDLVGYGNTASCFRGSGPTTAPSNITSVLRKTEGCTDTQNNASDFAAGAPNPRNTSAAINVCTTASFSTLREILFWGQDSF